MVLSGYILLTLPLVINCVGVPPQCVKGLIVDCNFKYENVIWTTENQNQCKPIMNRCFFNNENCLRFRQGRALLKETSKNDCQKLCVNDCGIPPKAPICAFRSNSDNYCTFGSECDLNKHICNTGQIWTRTLERFCETHASASVCP